MECRAGDGEEDGESLHPSVKVELERLNQASDEINKLENELDEARSRFSSTRNDSTQQLNSLAEKVKSSVIRKARPYYEAKEKARRAQEEALKAARQFQSANGIHRAAKETISLAEQKLSQEESGHVLSSEWQEMFNHATIRLMEAEKEKRRSEEVHQMKSRVFSDAEKHMHLEEKKHKRSIARARPYFERKAELQTKLEFLKVAVEALHDAVSQSKRKYSEALSNLELISNQVHEQRKGKLMLHLPREPGVGEESASPGPGGGVNLRTSFDDPDTPGIGQATFNISAEECDVIKEEDEDGEEEDVSESSSDVSDSSFKDTSSPVQPTEQSQLGGSVQSQKDTDSVQQTEPTGNCVSQVSRASEKSECESTCQRPKVLGNVNGANLCSKYDDLGEESNNQTANPEMDTNCSQKSKINETESRPSVGGSTLQGCLNVSSQKSLGTIGLRLSSPTTSCQHSPTGISSLSTPRTETSQAPSCVQHAPASSVIEHGHSPHPSTGSSLPQTPTVDSIQTSPDDNLQAHKRTANSETGTKTSDSQEFTTVSSSHETLPRPPVIGSSSEISDGRQK